MEQECIRRASLLLVSADLGAPPDLTPQSLHYLRWCEKSPSSQGQHSLQACFLLGEQVTTPPGGRGLDYARKELGNSGHGPRAAPLLILRWPIGAHGHVGKKGHSSLLPLRRTPHTCSKGHKRPGCWSFWHYTLIRVEPGP